MSFKIPAFISSHFSSLSHEERQEAIDKYKRWHSHEFTEMFIHYLGEQHRELVRKDEDTSDFLSKFQFSYVSITNKAKRKLIQDLINKMDWEV